MGKKASVQTQPLVKGDAVAAHGNAGSRVLRYHRHSKDIAGQVLTHAARIARLQETLNLVSRLRGEKRMTPHPHIIFKVLSWKNQLPDPNM